MGVLSLHQTPHLISLSPAVHTVSRTPSYHSAPSFFRGRGVAETGSAVVVVDVPSYRHISPPVTDLNARSVIVLAIRLTHATIVMMIRQAQLLFSTFMGIVQSIPTGMLTPEPLIT